jgi:hypothetical protein
MRVSAPQVLGLVNPASAVTDCQLLDNGTGDGTLPPPLEGGACPASPNAPFVPFVPAMSRPVVPFRCIYVCPLFQPERPDCEPSEGPRRRL